MGLPQTIAASSSKIRFGPEVLTGGNQYSTKAPPFLQSVKVSHQLAGGAEDFDQQIYHVIF